MILDPSDPTIAINSTIQFQGVSLKVSGTLAIASGIVSGTLSLTATDSSSGAVLFSKTYTISGLSVGNGRAQFLLKVPVGPYPLSVDVSINGNGPAWHATLDLTRNVDLLGHGSNDIADLGVVLADYNTKPGSVGYNPVADLAGRGTVDIIDLGIALLFYNATEYS